MNPIWALDESYKVNPQNGAILELDGPDYGDKAGHSYIMGNPVWDSAASLVRLSALRNETVGFQIMAPADPCLSGKISLTFGPGGKSNGRDDFLIRAYREWYIPSHEKWYADGLIPLESGKAFSLHEPDNKIPAQDWQGFYIEAFVPKHAAAGAHVFRFELRVGKSVIGRWTLELTVLPLTLPGRPAFTFELNSYGNLEPRTGLPPMKFAERLPHYASRAYEAQMLSTHRLARAHCSSLNVLHYSQNGHYCPSLVPGLDKDSVISGFSVWDRKFGPYLSGSAFKEGYGAGEPASIFYLPFSADYPAPFRWFPSEKYTRAITESVRAFERHIRRKGWTRTDYHLMLNHKQRRSIFPYNMDEPTRIRDFGILQYYGRAFLAGRSKKSPLKFRFDIGHYECTHDMDACDRLPGEIRCSHTDQMDGITDINVVSLCHAKRESFARRIRRGESVWLYQGASWITRPLTDMRQTLLHTYSLGAVGYCDWCLNGWGENPWVSCGPKFGFDYITYPGGDMGINEILPSMRLKQARRAVLDIECLELLKRCGKSKAAAGLLAGSLQGFNGKETSLMDDAQARHLSIPVVKPGFWEKRRERALHSLASCA